MEEESKEMATKTQRLLKSLRSRPEKKTPIATEMFLPNHSGDHSAGSVNREAVNENDLVNKKYVDNIATRGEIDLFLTENASDIGGYFDLEVDVITAAKENIVQSITASSTTLIASFASILDESIIDSITLLESGVHALHLHAEAAVAKNLFFYFEFYHRTAGGVETLLGTSHDSGELATSEAQYETHALIAEDRAFIPGDRIVIKIYGRNNSAADRSITIYMEGDTASRVEFPGFISLGNFVQKSGDTMTGDLTLAGANLSMDFGNFVSELNPDGADAIRIKGTDSVDVVIGSMTGLYAVWNVADTIPVFFVNERGDTDVTGDLTVTGDIRVSPGIITGVNITATGESSGFFDTFVGYVRNIAADAYAVDGSGTLMSSTRGWVAPYDGSITSMGISNVHTGGLGGSWTVYTRVNGTNKLSVVVPTGSAGTTNLHNKASRGSHTFSAGDVISFFFDETAGTSSITSALVHCRVQYDG